MKKEQQTLDKFPPEHHKHLQILMLDDSRKDAEMVKHFLREMGTFNVDFHECQHLEKGYRKIGELEPDLLILDYQFNREKTGLDLLKQLRENDNETPVVVLTAYNTHGIASKSFRYGANDFLSKQDMTPSTIQYAIRTAIQYPAGGTIPDHKESDNPIDPLTGLFRRQQMEQYLERKMDEPTGREDGRYALILVDVDDFRRLIQYHDYDMGDYVLSEIGNILKTMNGTSEVTTRFGGDEFCILMRIGHRKEAITYAEELLSRIKQILAEGPSGEPINITCSVGIGFLSEESAASRKALSLIFAAERALQNARYGSRSQISVAHS